MSTAAREIKNGDSVLVKHSVGGGPEVIIAWAGPGRQGTRALFDWAEITGASCVTHTIDFYPPKRFGPEVVGFVESPDIIYVLGVE
jgi:hypothetical protein